MVDLRDVLRKKESEVTVLQQEIEAIRTVLKILEKECNPPQASEPETPRVISKPAAAGGYSSVNIDTGSSGVASASTKPWTSILQARNS
jgi:hypothetical protein